MCWKRSSFTATELRDFERELSELKKRSQFLLDENVHPDAFDVLRKHGLNVTSISERRLSGRSDESIWEFARKHDRIIFTSDRDFLNERRFPLVQSPGVVVVPASSEGTEAMVKALFWAIYLVAHHREMWYQTKVEVGADGVFCVLIRRGDTSKIAKVHFWFRDAGPPFVRTDGTQKAS
jgi:predicted nuclease of predicted toxin-antitoxin system